VPLPQDITAFNQNLGDTLYKASAMDWLETTPGQAWMKILWTGSETGTWAVVLKWAKGYVAPAHKHLAPAHTFIIKGRLQVRDAVLETGDYVYEPNGVLHGATTALEDTEYLFICNGAVLFFDENNFTSYLSWEELERMRAAQLAAPAKSAAA
jgi:quercetin dioxygenase-like cupin family protein